MHLSEILNHLGEDREDYFLSISPPVIQTSNFAFRNIEHMRSCFMDEFSNHLYTRGNNPTTKILRQKLAALEGSEDALVFGSGVAAISAAVIANVKAGDHVVCISSPYSWTHTLLTKYLPRFGVTHSFVDGRDLEAIRKALIPSTSVLFLESPNTMWMHLQDLEACAQMAKEKGITTIIDNSYASPIYQNPIALGIDIVVHSGTKYLNGHSDVVFGALCGTKEMVRHIFETEFMTIGAILSPHDASLVIRGLRTLELRMERSNKTALALAEKLEQHPMVESVNHPLLPSNPQYELAKKQMKGAGGLFSFFIKADKKEEVFAFVEKLKHFTLAVSWGGHESLIIPMAAFYDMPGRENPSAPLNLVRLYIGLEELEFLWDDLNQALNSLK
jgi:cystathionine beta-lyase